MMKKTLVALMLALGSLTAMAQKTEVMKGMGMSKPEAAAQQSHKTTGTVKTVDQASGVVTVAHRPVPSLNWPAMTMGFKVRDKALMDTLAIGKRVDFEFMQKGKDYAITAVK